MKQFIFESYDFDTQSRVASFSYSFDGQLKATERLVFPESSYKNVDPQIFDLALRHAFIVLGVSYFNAFPESEIAIKPFSLTTTQVDYFNRLYRNGLGEFWFVNQLSPDIFKGFSATGDNIAQPPAYNGEGILLLSSGGKDSLLSSLLLQKARQSFTPLFITNDGRYPHMIDGITGEKPLLVERQFDTQARKALTEAGGRTGHVPFSAILAAISLLTALLSGTKIVAVSNESSANEGTAKIGDFVANHAWSKSYDYERMLQDYVHTFITSGLEYVSLVRQLTDLNIAEQFTKLGWEKYGSSFSSCNQANYKLGQQAETLTWCGQCDKCANAWLTFSPFLAPDVLTNLFGRNLIQDPAMKQKFMDLLGLGEHKPFECVGTIEELRTAYHLAEAADPEYILPDVDVPRPDNYDFRRLDVHQPLVDDLLS